jgi:hypothetical protein
MLFRTLLTTVAITSAVALSACSDSKTEINTEANPAAVTEVQTNSATEVESNPEEAAIVVAVSEEKVDPASPEKPAISTSMAIVVTSQVEAINHETRVVTLSGQDGKPVTFTASDEARNLDQVEVGDTVTAEYLQNLTIQVLAAENAEPGAGGVAVAARAEEGEKPGMAVIDAQVEVFTVEEINIEANTFKLKGADGVVNEFTAREPENLKKSAVGDVVVMTFTQAVAISVEEKAAE